MDNLVRCSFEGGIAMLCWLRIILVTLVVIQMQPSEFIMLIQSARRDWPVFLLSVHTLPVSQASLKAEMPKNSNFHLKFHWKAVTYLKRVEVLKRAWNFNLTFVNLLSRDRLHSVVSAHNASNPIGRFSLVNYLVAIETKQSLE